MDLLGQLARGERGKSPAEGWLTGNVAGAFPAAEPPQGRPAGERFEQGRGGRELIHALGDERLHQPHPGMGRRAVAAPFVRPGEATEITQCQDFTKLLVESAQRPDLFFERREKLALEMEENNRKRRHPHATLARHIVPSSLRNNHSSSGVLKEPQVTFPLRIG